MQALNQIRLFKHLQTLGLAKVLILTLSLVFSCSTFALEFRSVTPAKAVLYDAPSKEASKLYILGGGYPVEIIVSLGDWTKVRDQLGALSWIESKLLNSKRTVLVTTKTDIKLAEDATSALVATVEKDVVLELVSPNIKNGWVKVKHRDGVIGFVQASSVWGLN
jgi:SH3-like domain-containing protein